MSLTTEQEIRLSVFKMLVHRDTSTDTLIEDIKKVSAVIYGEEWPVVEAIVPVLPENFWGANARNGDGSVTYEGVTFNVPSWTRYVAADFDGEVYAFERKPMLEDGETTARIYNRSDSDTEMESIGYKLPDLDPNNTRGNSATYPILDIGA